MPPDSPSSAESVRLDKWLWAARLYKTRSQAADACRLLRVRMAHEEAKAARQVKIGDCFEIHLEDLVRIVRVIGLLDKRVAAKLVPHYLEDLTPASTYAEAKARREERALSPPIAPAFKPNKKDRELLEKLYHSPEE